MGDEKADGKEQPSKVFINPEKRVSFTRARIERPDRFSFAALHLRPSWFVNNVDGVRAFNFSNVEWRGISSPKQGSVSTKIKALCDWGIEWPHLHIERACRQL